MINLETVGFLRDLAANNSKSWFDDNRRRYERDVKGPFRALCAEIAVRLLQTDAKLPGLSAEAIAAIPSDPRDGILRINRDLRFSKDKTPYHSHLRVAFVPGGRRSGNPGLYLTIEPDLVGAGGGVYRTPRAYPPGLPRLAEIALADQYRDSIDAAAENGLRKGESIVAIVGTEPEEFLRMPDQAGWVMERFAEVSPLVGALL